MTNPIHLQKGINSLLQSTFDFLPLSIHSPPPQKDAQGSLHQTLFAWQNNLSQCQRRQLEKLWKAGREVRALRITCVAFIQHFRSPMKSQLIRSNKIKHSL